MSSNINPYNIDGTFPIAGQDNDSQGFRDNFTNIRNNFVFSKDEIQDLQNKVILKSALTGTSLSNDMNGTILESPQLKSWTETSYTDLINVSGDITVDFTNGNFQKIVPNGPVTLDFTNWPLFAGTNAAGYGVVRVWIEITNVDYTVTLPDSVNIGVTDIAGYDADTSTITFDDTGNYVFDISSVDSGENYLIFDLKRNRTTLRDPSLYYNNEVNSTLLVGWRQGFETALLLNQGQNTISSRGSYNSVVVSNIANASILSGTVDGQLAAGYTLTATRGNLEANVFTPVGANDYLGYYNAVTYTGFGGVANTFQQTASMTFYATGSNVTYGRGGNVAFYTKPDGGTGTLQGVRQALGLENDQSVKVFGNLITAGSQIVTGYQYYAPTTNFAANINGGVSRFVMDPTGAITNGNLRLPAGVADGTVVQISSTETVTNLSVWNGSTDGVKPSANVTLTAGTSIEYFWHNSESKWYKVR